jgi:hypothetical protein
MFIAILSLFVVSFLLVLLIKINTSRRMKIINFIISVMFLVTGVFSVINIL